MVLILCAIRTYVDFRGVKKLQLLKRNGQLLYKKWFTFDNFYTTFGDSILEEAINIKLVVLGEKNVGKTSLVNTFLGEELPSEYLPTIGNNVNHKDYVLDNVKIRVNIWDCGGQKAFNPFNPAVYNNVDAAFLVFDLLISRAYICLKHD